MRYTYLMARRLRSKQSGSTEFIIIAAGGALLVGGLFEGKVSLGSAMPYLQTVGFVLLVLLAVVLALVIYRHLTEKSRARGRVLVESNAIDGMSGREFETFLQKLLTARGYKARIVGGSGDNGVDLVAEKDGDRYSIQVKRQKKPVNRRAVTDAVAGMKQHRCNRAMAITNNFFTSKAVEFARLSSCELVDRDILGSWLQEAEYQEAVTWRC